MIAEFPARQCKWRTMFDHVKTLILSAMPHSCLVSVIVDQWELTQASSWLMT